MRYRLTQNDVSNKINVESVDTVNGAVRRIYLDLYPGASHARLDHVFSDFKRLFSGKFPGYFACDTRFHDLRHTLDVTLAMARLIDGYERNHIESERLGEQRALLGLIVALLHDAGYIRRHDDKRHKNGAEFTLVHVARSAQFMRQYLPSLGLAPDRVTVAGQIAHFTGFEIALNRIQIDHPKDRLLGYMLGTADLLGQMSDRLYLEKCRDYLYPEFVLGGVARVRHNDGSERINYSSPEDLLSKTPGFHQKVAHHRLHKEFHGVEKFAQAHFDGLDLYGEEIRLNIGHLGQMLEQDDFDQLRRQSCTVSSATH